MSLIKFLNQQKDANGRGKLYWGRADQDGLPFRGPAVPNYTQEEYEDKVVRVADPHNGTFRTWIPEENAAYLDMLDKCLHHWGRIMMHESWKQKVKLGDSWQLRFVHYVVWAEYFMEDGTRTTVPGYSEHTHGQGHLPGNPLPGP